MMSVNENDARTLRHRRFHEAHIGLSQNGWIRAGKPALIYPFGSLGLLEESLQNETICDSGKISCDLTA